MVQQLQVASYTRLLSCCQQLQLYISCYDWFWCVIDNDCITVLQQSPARLLLTN
jgi:hypothetical protein